MKVTRFEVRLNENEKKLLSKLAKSNGMSTSDYLRFKVFEDNRELIDSEHIYESPSKDKHNFYTMGVLHDIYFLLCYLVSSQFGEDTFKETSKECREKAKNKLNQYGYLKIRTKDE